MKLIIIIIIIIIVVIVKNRKNTKTLCDNKGALVAPKRINTIFISAKLFRSIQKCLSVYFPSFSF